MKSQATPKVAREDVLRVIRRDFAAVEEAEVIAILELFGTSDRVHLAILKLADGDLSAVWRYTDTACADYRDVIALAEYPGYHTRGCLAPGERAKTSESDWTQYQQWLLRE